MPDRLRKFLAAVKAARDENAAEKQRLINRLKRLTPEQFVQVSRDELQQLTDQEYAAIVRHVAPNHQSARLPEVVRQKSRRWLLWLVWSGLPTFLRASIAGLTLGFLILGASLAAGPAIDWLDYEMPPVRPKDVRTWPHCPRLSAWVDGCTYTPKNNLAWAQAASLLAVPEAELREANPRIPESYIPAGSLLVVWRYRGSLQGINE